MPQLFSTAYQGAPVFWSAVSWSSTYLNFSLFYPSLTFLSILNRNKRSSGGALYSGWEGMIRWVAELRKMIGPVGPFTLSTQLDLLAGKQQQSWRPAPLFPPCLSAHRCCDQTCLLLLSSKWQNRATSGEKTGAQLSCF